MPTEEKIKQMEEEMKNMKDVIGHLIAQLSMELGRHNATLLLDKLFAGKELK